MRLEFQILFAFGQLGFGHFSCNIQINFQIQVQIVTGEQNNVLIIIVTTRFRTTAIVICRNNLNN